jgi:hypothetical protein
LQTFAGGGSSSTFKPGSVAAPSNRLYLGKDKACTLADPCTLSPTPGTVLVPAAGSYQFPVVGDNSLIAGTMVIIPPRSDMADVQYPAPPSGIRSWVGSFSGSLIGAPEGSCMQLFPSGPVVCDPTHALQSVTRFEIYANDCLNAGYQNCTAKQVSGNDYNFQVAYFFDTNKCDPTKGYLAVDPMGNPCNADRIERYNASTGAVTT